MCYYIFVDANCLVINLIVVGLSTYVLLHASMMIVFELTMLNYYIIVFVNRQIHRPTDI
jgi:hypothetical protein